MTVSGSEREKAMTTDRRIDRTLQGAFALALAGWSALLWNTGQNLSHEMQLVATQQARLLERMEDVIDDLRRHESTYAHEGAREALISIGTTVTRMQDELNRSKETSEKRDDIHMNRLTEVERRLNHIDAEDR